MLCYFRPLNLYSSFSNLMLPKNIFKLLSVKKSSIQWKRISSKQTLDGSTYPRQKLLPSSVCKKLQLIRNATTYTWDLQCHLVDDRVLFIILPSTEILFIVLHRKILLHLRNYIIVKFTNNIVLQGCGEIYIIAKIPQFFEKFTKLKSFITLTRGLTLKPG